MFNSSFSGMRVWYQRGTPSPCALILVRVKGLYVRSSNWDISYSLLSSQSVSQSVGWWDATDEGGRDAREFVTRLREQFPVLRY